MPAKPDSLAQLRASLEKIERDILQANKAATRCPQVRALLSKLTTGRQDDPLMDPDTAASMRAASTAYLRMLDAAAASPFAEMARSPAVLAALKRPVI